MGVPTWMYRDTKDGVESAIFDSDDPPKGWRDTPDRGKPAADEQDDGKARK